MKRVIVIILGCCVGMVLAGCEKPVNKDIIGCWTNPAYADNFEGKVFIYYKRSNTLRSDSEGIRFLNDGRLIERKVGRFCGSPPPTVIPIVDYSGKWCTQNDNIIIDISYGSGTEHRVWKIIKVSKTSLEIEVVSQETYNKY